MEEATQALVPALEQVLELELVLQLEQVSEQDTQALATTTQELEQVLGQDTLALATTQEVELLQVWVQEQQVLELARKPPSARPFTSS